MKRRNVDASKTRRPVKKIPKIYDSFYTSLVVYVKLALLWICVMGGDFLLDFRLEYLYPIYLLLHNAYEAYKFQGIAFALLLICIVVSVDVICLGVVPAPWLYLLGSLAVWGQVSWSQTLLGTLLLLPTLIFIDDLRPSPSQPLSPLAAHCVGFPMVSLGFALKSFIGSKLKQRTRNEVGRQNELLFSILWEALPSITPPVNNNEVLNNGSAVLIKKQQSPPVSRRKSLENGEVIRETLSNGGTEVLSSNAVLPHQNGKISNGSTGPSPVTAKESNHAHHNHNFNHHNHINSGGGGLNSSASSPNSSHTLPNNNSSSSNSSHSSSGSSPNQYATPCPTCAAALLAPKKKKDDCCIKLESEVRRLRSDLHSVRSIETDLRSQISSLHSSERNLRGDIALLQGEHEALQLKYSALLSKSQEERQSYEKKLSEERRQKDNAIKKQTKASLECSGDCKRKLRDADKEKDTLRRDNKTLEEKITRLERELQNVKSTLLLEQKNKESAADTAKLLSHLSALQDQNAQLEASLGAETRLKLDLFSALGEARRQLSIRDAMIKSKEDDLEEIRAKYVELLAVSDFTSHTAHPQQQQISQQQGIRSTQMHSIPAGQPGQVQHQHLLKGLVMGDANSQQHGRENLSYSPLIES